jgi:glycosyltransferase involved in cell wall biosynthesis
MKVLLVVPAVGDVYGGTSKIVVELARSLGATGLRTDVVTTNANGNGDLDVPTGVWVDADGYRIKYFPYSKRGDYKFSFALTRWMSRRVRDYDVVHTHAIFSYPVLPAHWFCHRNRVPYLMTPHGMLEPWALSYKARKKSLYYRWVEQAAFNNARAVHVTSSPEVDSVRRLGIKAPVLYVPNGVDLTEFERAHDAAPFRERFPETGGKRLVLFLGRVDPKKGLDLLAPALRQLRDGRPDVHCVVAGPDNVGFEPAARGHFERAGCADAVTFTGMLAGEMKHAALAAAAAYVAPSYSEGFSMSILEGMASGLPCVFTKGCNFPEAAEAKVARVVDADAGALASALGEVLDDPAAADRMGAAARDFVFNNYTWAHAAARLKDAYRAMMRPPVTGGAGGFAG